MIEIDRMGLIFQPKKAFIDWLKEIHKNQPLFLFLLLKMMKCLMNISKLIIWNGSLMNFLAGVKMKMSGQRRET